MIDQQLLVEAVVPRVKSLCESVQGKSLEKAVMKQLHIPSIKKVEDEQEAISLVYNGSLLLYFEEEDLLFSCDIAKRPNRNPEQTNTEATIKGPRDNFIEDLAVNIALLRKRLPTNSFCVEKIEIGKRSKTSVAILYFDDIADQKNLDKIRGLLQKIDTDIVFSGDIVMEHINKKAILFPRHDYTGRPDYAIQSLVRGRFVILVDGVAYAIITPVNLFFLLKTSEDNEYPVIFGSVERMMRIIGLSIGALLPGFWLALTTYHQNQLPFQMLATVVQSNVGLPLPSALEMFVMLGMFELLREAGLRLPTVLGSTIGVVGGLIIGDAAIRAGITSPAMIVIIATSIVASFTLLNQSLVTSISITRIFIIVLTAFFGFFGFFMGIFFILVYLSNIRTFDVSYMSIATKFNWKSIGKTLFRLPGKDYTKRPEMLKPQDNTRSKEAKDE